MKKNYRRVILISLIILAVFILFRIPIVRGVANVVLISFIISYSLKPFHNRITSYGASKNLAAALLILGLVAVFLITFIILIPRMFKESMNIGNTLLQLKDIIDRVNDNIAFMRNNKTFERIINNMYDRLNVMFVSFFERAFDRFLLLGEHLLSIAVIPVLVYYFLSENDRITNRMLLFVPVESRSVFKKICEDIDKVLSRYIVSQFFLCFVVGGLTFLILVLLKVNYPVLLSILNALFNIIPYFGPFFGALPALLMALLGSPRTAFWAAIWLYAIQQIEGDIISPKITGDSVSMHPLVVILLLLVGGKIGGFVGMVLAVPVGVIIKIIYEDLNYYLF